MIDEIWCCGVFDDVFMDYWIDYRVQVTNGDVTGRDFVLRPAQTTMEVAGRVVIPDVHLASTKVVLYREDRPETPVQILQLQQASMFYLQNIPIDNAVRWAAVLRLRY
jgi:hypothetical protein